MKLKKKNITQKILTDNMTGKVVGQTSRTFTQKHINWTIRSLPNTNPTDCYLGSSLNSSCFNTFHNF